MENQNPDFNLNAIKNVTKLLLMSGFKIKSDKNSQEQLKTRRISMIKQKIDLLESTYVRLKKENKDDVRLDNLKIHLNLIKNKLEEIA
ncbi:MAG: hypothetical protein PHV16_02855 [Candidatus Nanoarchaeia archaeon]|nr:hypothetical protein [Candidatus Nanoarchaeia archaeon]